jgi:hypothetical protein
LAEKDAREDGVISGRDRASGSENVVYKPEELTDMLRISSRASSKYKVGALTGGCGTAWIRVFWVWSPVRGWKML